MKVARWFLLLLMISLLSACKGELFSGLDESEANQMMALLMYNGIDTDKVADKSGVTLLVDNNQFVNAIEVLRQNGFPRRKTATMEDIFPSGQLVTSPEQERAKLNYLRSQQIEAMLNNMDGVITANISISQPDNSEGDVKEPTSASVFIKYSPEVNLPAQVSTIRSLIRNGVQGLAPERISITLQRSEYRYQVKPIIEHSRFIETFFIKNNLTLMPVVTALVIILLGALISVYIWLKRRAKAKV